MIARARTATLAAALILFAGLMAVGSHEVRAQMANPCGPHAPDPCAGQPEVDPELIVRPKDTSPFRGDGAQLIKQGETLFKSAKLSTNELSCQSCHSSNENFAAEFGKPYPHKVEMAKRKAGLAKINLDEMIQFCMVVPMAAKPLHWDSRELAALTAYTSQLQSTFRAAATKH